MITHLVRILILVLCITATTLEAQVPQLINYQGRVAVGSVNFDGVGQFKFALVNTNGSTTYWSNDGTSVAGSQPTNPVSLTVAKGLYSVQLGDTSLVGMTLLPVTVFINSDVRLRVWFNDGTNGFQLLTPDQRIVAVGYAIVAAGLELPVTSSDTEGVIAQAGVPLIHTFGTRNFFAGSDAGNFTLTGSDNIGIGQQSLLSNTTGHKNIAIGLENLTLNTTGILNIAIGHNALASNVSGNQNFAGGAYALYSASTGGANTAIGYASLQASTGSNNTGFGWSTLRNIVTGNSNTAIGHAAATNLTSGAGNIAIGSAAGLNLTTGNNNIDIGHAGVAGDTGIIRIGSSQTDTYIAGVIHGDGSGLTNVPAANVSGTFSSAQLSSGLTLAGTTIGSFSGSLTGNATTATTAASFSGTLTGDVTGTQNATVVSSVGGSSAANVHTAELAANAATNANTASTIVKRDADGKFSTGSVTTGTISLPPTTSATAGVIIQNGVPLIHTYETNNFFAGISAGNFTTTGADNVGIGFQTLTSTTTARKNIAIGTGALTLHQTGLDNVAIGTNALATSVGAGQNFAGGSYAMETTTGSSNTAVGYSALRSSGASNNNTAFGWTALRNLTNGNGNIALGHGAASNVLSGSGNIAIGVAAASNLTNSANNNIIIGNAAVAGDTATTRIGSSQTRAFVAGITGVSVSGGVSVFVDANGQLGTTVSSRRYKDEIKDMDKSSEALLSLRPVTFNYKPEIDPKAIPQYGLIAEEVNEVAPDLVIRNEKGEIQTVRYEQVNAMLLNEFLKQHKRVAELEKRLAELETKDKEREARLTRLEQFIPAEPKSNGPSTAALNVGEYP